MAVMAREAWTDERLDDFKVRVEQDFAEVKGELREFRTETNARFDSMQRTLVVGFASIGASTVASVIGTALVT
jgi:hypothetical protein